MDKFNYYSDAMYLPEDELLNRLQGGYEILEMRGEEVSAYTELSTGARYSIYDGICTSFIAPLWIGDTTMHINIFSALTMIEPF